MLFHFFCLLRLLEFGMTFQAESGMISAVKNSVFLIAAFYTSYLGSIFVLFPALLLIWIWPYGYRYYADRAVGFWLTLPVVCINYLVLCWVGHAWHRVMENGMDTDFFTALEVLPQNSKIILSACRRRG